MKVLVVEDIDALRNKYIRILKSDPDIEVVGGAENGYEGVIYAALYRPDVVLMDIEMETKNAGIEATRQILKKLPDCKIIILTVHQDDLLIYAAFEEGVSNYIFKNVTAPELIAAVKNAYEHADTLKRTISDRILEEFKRVRKEEQKFSKVIDILMRLTPSELHIIYLFWLGKSRQEICEIRYIEPTSLKTHVHNILKKMHCGSVEEVLSMVEKVRLFEFIKEFLPSD